MDRRTFMSALAAAPVLGQSGSVYADPVTGAEIRELVAAPATASNLYFHFSNFTADNRHVIFAREENGLAQICAADTATAGVTPLTRERGAGATAACPHPADAALVYYPQGRALMELNRTSGQSRRVGEVAGIQGGLGQPTFSHDLKSLATGFQRDERTWEIGLMEIASGAYRTVLRQGFRIGHVQHHPILPVIFYVWETGGYAPQRTWLVNADGTGNRPYYASIDPKQWVTPLKEWVTHEAWIRDTGEMTLILDKTGILIADVEGKARLLPGDYWHVAARADGRVLVADDNAGRLWLIESATNNRRLIATGLRDGVRAVHAHASFCRTGRYVFFNTGRRHATVAWIDLTRLPRAGWELPA